MIDPASGPVVSRVTTGHVCPDCSFAEVTGAVVHRLSLPAVPADGDDEWRDLGGGDA